MSPAVVLVAVPREAPRLSSTRRRLLSVKQLASLRRRLHQRRPPAASEDVVDLANPLNPMPKANLQPQSPPRSAAGPARTPLRARPRSLSPLKLTCPWRMVSLDFLRSVIKQPMLRYHQQPRPMRNRMMTFPQLAKSRRPTRRSVHHHGYPVLRRCFADDRSCWMKSYPTRVLGGDVCTEDSMCRAYSQDGLSST